MPLAYTKLLVLLQWKIKRIFLNELRLFLALAILIEYLASAVIVVSSNPSVGSFSKNCFCCENTPIYCSLQQKSKHFYRTPIITLQIKVSFGAKLLPDVTDVLIFSSKPKILTVPVKILKFLETGQRIK